MNRYLQLQALTVATALVSLLVFGSTAQAGTTLHWDPANSTNGTSSSGGTGAWDAGSLFWEVTPGAVTNFSYTTTLGRDPVFGGNTGGTVTISTGFLPIVDAMTFNATGDASTYVIARTGTGAVSLNAAAVPITANVNASISSVIGQQAAGNGFNKLGAGTLTLSGASANTYTGTTTVSAGTLVLAKTANVAAVPGAVNITGGTLQVNPTATEQIPGAITVNGGTFDLRGTGYQGGAASITFNSGVITDGDGTINSQINLSGNLTIRGNLSVPINVAPVGAATTGIIYDATGNLGTSTVSGNITFVGSKQITVGDSAGTTNELHISGQINEFAVTSGLTKAGAGRLTLSGANTYAGITTISAGILSINTIGNVSGGASSLGAPTTAANGAIALNSTLTYTGVATSTNRNFTFGGTTSNLTNASSSNGLLTLDGTIAVSSSSAFNINPTGGDILINGVISGTGGSGLFINGVGRTVTLANANNSFNTAVNLYQGTLSIASISNAGANSALGSGTNISLGHSSFTFNPTLQFTGASGGSSSRPIFVQAPALSTGGGSIENTVAGQTLTLSGTVQGSTGTPTLTLTGAGNVVLSGVISNGTATSLAITKSGAGILTLSGSAANTYSGLTTVSAGTLVLAKTANVAALPGAVNITGGTLRVDATAFEQIPGVISVNGGTFDLRGSGYRGTANSIIFNSGSIIDGDGGTNSQINLSNTTTALSIRGGLSVPIDLALAAAGTGGIVYDATGNLGTSTLSGVITLVNGQKNITVNDSSGTTNELHISGNIGQFGGTAGITKLAAGTLTLSGTNGYAGSTTISAGVLQLGNGGTTGALTATASITNNANLTINRSNAFTQATDLNGKVISGTGSFTQAGSGTTTLSLLNTYTGVTAVTGGTLSFTGVGGLAALNNGVTVATGATILLAGNSTKNNVLGNNPAMGAWNVGGTINSTGGGAHTMPATVNLTGGTITGIAIGAVDGNFTSYGYGTLFNGLSTTVNATGNSTISAATIGVPSTLTLSPTGASDTLAVSSVIGVNNVSPMITGANSIAGGLTKTGLGTVTLSGASIYTGATTVQGGTLELAGAAGALTNTSSVTVGSSTFLGGSDRLLLTNTNPHTLGTGDLVVGSSEAGTVDHNAGNVTVGNAAADAVRIGAGGLGITGVYNINNGVMSTLNVGPGGIGNLIVGDTSTGTLNVGNNATINTGDLTVGNTGTGIGQVNQNGGVVNVLNPSTLDVGLVGPGEFNLMAGTLNVAGDATLGDGGGDGDFQHTGGTANITRNLIIGNSSAPLANNYNLSGGVLNFGDTTGAGAHHGGGTTPSAITINSDGAFNFNGGTLQDVTTINTISLAGTFIQNDTNGATPQATFIIGQDEGAAGGPLGPPYARTTTINGGFSLLNGIVKFDAFGADITPQIMSDFNLDPVDHLIVTGNVHLESIIDFDDEYGAAFGDIHSLIKAPSITTGPGFGTQDAFFRIVNDGMGGQILQAIVPEPASVAVWTIIGLAGAAGAWRMRRKGTKGSGFSV